MVIDTRLKEYELDKSTFMGAWYINPHICEALIDYFEASQDKVEGTCGDSQGNPHVDKSIKDSTDISIKGNNFHGIIGIYREELQKVLECYKQKYPEANNVEKFNIREYNIQKYAVKGGFKKWHSENGGNNQTIKRHLVFMTYLNDVEDDGGTEFLHQNIVTPCQKGLTLIWPAGWTHVHRGVVNETQEKYIITGWYEFE